MKDLNIETVLESRGKTHGSYEYNAVRTMQAFDILDNRTLPEPIRLAMFMVVHKLSRISCGNYKELDHWTDIVGYATLARKFLTDAEE